MLAAMLPTSHHLSHSGPHSAASTSHPSPSASPAPSKRKAKAAQPKAQQPSLIALTKGANASNGSAHASADSSAQGSPRRKHKQVAGAGESASSPSAAKAKAAAKKSAAAMIAASEGPSASLLSRSAPTAGAKDEWDMPKTAATSGLTWQQELLNGASNNKKASTAASSAAPKQRKSNRKDKDAAPSTAKDSSPGKEALTWQQALFATNAPSTGRRYDQIKDARDAATFGEAAPASAVAKKGRARSGSVGNDNTAGSKGKAKGKKNGAAAAHDSHPSNGPIHIDDLFAQQQFGKANSTPPKARQQQHHHAAPGLALPAAYAGPEFHNSPAPNSLPAPKFTRRADRNTSAPAEGNVGDVSFSSSGTSGSSSDEEDGASRYIRGATAPAAVAAVSTPPRPVMAASSPPAAPASVDRSATIESLLARMMAPSKPTAA